MFEVTIREILSHPDGATKAVEIDRYRQVVDALDIPGVMAAVNRKPHKPKERKEKA